jgi:CheY-like chemotaxis protein
LPQRVVGDQDRLRQVLLNLLNNAVKFTPQGRVHLRVEVESEQPTGHVIRFTVEDTGIGIPQEKLYRLFQRFSQVDSSIRRRFGGTGLGLAISRSLVERMGGSIRVASVPGKGSHFAISIPLESAEPEAGDPTRDSGQPPPRARRRVLLVEDVEINQELARLILEAGGHEVDVVSDGAAAVKAVQDERYDLVLMDIQMPVMDGMTATRLIRALDPPMRDVPIIAMTANVLPQQVEEFRSAGMADHIGKPFKRDELYAAIERWTGGSDPGWKLAEAS